MLRCIRYEFAKIFSRKLVPILWLCLLVLNGTLFSVRQHQSNPVYFSDPAYFLAEEQAYAEMPFEDALAELEQFHQNMDGLVMLDIIQTTESDETMRKVRIQELLEMHPEMEELMQDEALMKNLNSRLQSSPDLYQQYAWVAQYPKYLDYVQQQADNMQEAQIFNKKNSFAKRNVLKTAEDFAACRGIHLEVTSQRFFEAFHSWQLGDGLTIFFLLMVSVILFLKEQENGMEKLIRAAPNGRLVTMGAKLCTGICMAAAGVLTFSGEILLISGALYGFPDWNLAVQSIPVFRECPFLLSFWQYAVLFFLQKTAALVLILSIFAFLVPLFRSTQLVYFGMVAVGGLEYLFYRVLHPSSYFNGLKFLNIFYLLSPAHLFTEYENLNFFGFPLGIAPSLCIFWCSITLIFFTLCCIFSVKKPQMDWNFLLITRKCRPERGSTSLTFQEGWRAMIPGKGVVVWILAVFLMVSWYRDMPVMQMNMEEASYRQYITQFGGTLTPEKEREIESLQEEFDAVPGKLLEIQENLQAGNITKEEYNDQKYELLIFSQQGEGFPKFYQQYSMAKLAAMQGLEPVLVDEFSADFLFDNRRRDFISSVVMILLLMLAILPFGSTGENMEHLIHSTPKGRTVLFSRRILFTVCCAAGMSLGRWIPIFLTFRRQYAIADWSAAIQHLEPYLGWQGRMGMGQYLILWIGLQLLAALVYGLAFLCLAQMQRRTSAAALTSILLIFLTLGAFLAKVPGFHLMNPAEAFLPLSPVILDHRAIYMGALIAESAVLWGVGMYQAEK